MHRVIKKILWLTVSLIIVLALLLAGPAYMLASQRVALGGVWSQADRSPVGLAPAPQAHPEALVQVYAARAFDWRGAFGVHTWIATKPTGATHYQVIRFSDGGGPRCPRVPACPIGLGMEAPRPCWPSCELRRPRVRFPRFARPWQRIQ